MPVAYGDGHRGLPPAAPTACGKRYFGGEIGARPVHRRAGHLPRAGDDLTVYDLFDPVRSRARPVRQPAPARGRRDGPPHRRRPGRPRARRVADLARRRAGLRRASATRSTPASTPFLHGSGQVRLYDRGEQLYDLVEAFDCNRRRTSAAAASCRPRQRRPNRTTRRSRSSGRPASRAGTELDLADLGLRAGDRVSVTVYDGSRIYNLAHGAEFTFTTSGVTITARLHGPGALRDRDPASGRARRRVAPRTTTGARSSLPARPSSTPAGNLVLDPDGSVRTLDRPGARRPPSRALQLRPGRHHVLHARAARDERSVVTRRRRADHHVHPRPGGCSRSRPSPRGTAVGARVAITYTGPRLHARGAPVYVPAPGGRLRAGDLGRGPAREGARQRGAALPRRRAGLLRVRRPARRRQARCSGIAMTGADGLGDALLYRGIEELTVITGGGDDDVTVVSTHTGHDADRDRRRRGSRGRADDRRRHHGPDRRRRRRDLRRQRRRLLAERAGPTASTAAKASPTGSTRCWT